MNMSHDILFGEDSQNDIDLVFYALREENLANSISSLGTAKTLWTFSFAAAFLPKRVAVIDVAHA